MRLPACLYGLLILFAAVIAAPPAHAAGPLVLAAASLQESLTAAADTWAAKGNERPRLSFAASSALARQIIAGAPADIFISADEAWMDAVAAKGLIRRGSRTAFLSNRLVLIAPASAPLRIAIRPGFPLARALGHGRLAMADPDAVPAGRYGRQALTHLGIWAAVEPRLVRAENVRAALALVERAEARAGIVYATDARAAKSVTVVGIFPAASHRPITYPAAVLAASANADAGAFFNFLMSREGRAIFTRHGFQTRLP